MSCDGCAYEKTQYCLICVDGDMYTTEDQKAYNDMMCDLMCGDPDDNEDCTEEWNKYYNDTRL